MEKNYEFYKNYLRYNNGTGLLEISNSTIERKMSKQRQPSKRDDEQEERVKSTRVVS